MVSPGIPNIGKDGSNFLTGEPVMKSHHGSLSVRDRINDRFGVNEIHDWVSGKSRIKIGPSASIRLMTFRAHFQI
jgi:hypothetical protein